MCKWVCNANYSEGLDSLPRAPQSLDDPVGCFSNSLSLLIKLTAPNPSEVRYSDQRDDADAEPDSIPSVLKDVIP